MKILFSKMTGIDKCEQQIADDVLGCYKILCINNFT